ncbi:hypothetical protein VNO78_11256 [Psophocarpus tetragonolobus]|uniref:Uncharacterized protein n=1 Tax=Psophocarpus tetragonolobus TaxID=3891 RepID=A0AAN9XNR8_PSOTE
MGANKLTIPDLSFLPFSDGYDSGFNPSLHIHADFKLYRSELKQRSSHFVCNLILSTANPFTLLWIQPAPVFDILYHYFHGHADYINHQTKASPSCSISLSPPDLPSFLLLSKPSVLSFILPLFQKQFLQLDQETNPTVLVNTFDSLEVDSLRAIHNINMIPIGPLIPSAFLDGKDATDSTFGGDIFPVSNDYLQWLDSKEDKSVVYVSFGSYLELSMRQME